MAYFISNQKFYDNYIFVCDICTLNYNNNYFNNPDEILQIIKQYEIKKNYIYYHDIKYKLDWCNKCHKNYNFSIDRRYHFIKKIN